MYLVKCVECDLGLGFGRFVRFNNFARSWLLSYLFLKANICGTHMWTRKVWFDCYVSVFIETERHQYSGNNLNEHTAMTCFGMTIVDAKWLVLTLGSGNCWLFTFWATMATTRTGLGIICNKCSQQFQSASYFMLFQ